jgi:NADH-quinone oxidoreductase subunit I
MLGDGILKGLAETAKNFAGSFVSKERMTTVEYPEERLPLPEAARNFPFLVYDGEDWEKGLRCVACQICEKECPPKCIYIEKSKDKKPDYVGKPQIYPAKFDIDISVCMSCQICVEVCPFEAIKMNTEFELATDDRFGGLLLDRRELARSNEYYHQIHPTEASEVDARLAEEKAKVEAKAKAAAAAAAAKAAAAPATVVPAAPAVAKPAASADPKAASGHPKVASVQPAAPTANKAAEVAKAPAMAIAPAAPKPVPGTGTDGPAPMTVEEKKAAETPAKMNEGEPKE